MEEYTLVYDFFETRDTFDTSGLMMPLVGGIGLLYAIFKAKQKRTFAIVFLSVYTLFSLSLFLFSSIRAHKAYSKIEDLYKNNEFKTVEGVVSNYSPMKIKGHGSREFFFVDNVYFSYSDYIEIDGYNNSCVKGGAICENGQYVKIAYYQGLNLSLEEPLESLPLNSLDNRILKLYIKK